MSSTYDGQNPARAIWDAIDAALELPTIGQGTTPTLALTLGRRHLGWVLAGASRERAGPALDITGGSVVLNAARYPQKRALIEREGGDYGEILRVWGGPLWSITGTITSGTTGAVSFALTATHTDGVGRFLLEPRVTLASGEIVVPRRLRTLIVAAVGSL